MQARLSLSGESPTAVLIRSAVTGFLVLTLCFLGCASSGQVMKKGLPDWYKNPPNADEGQLYSAAVGQSRDMVVATKKAKVDARSDLAQQMATKVQNLEKLFSEEVGTDAESELLEQFTSVTKAIASETLHGSQEEEKEVHDLEDGTIRVYVLMSLPIGAANQALMAKIKANEHLYTRFRASQAFEELNAEIEAYETARGQ